MAPISAGILTGVLANALTPILGQLAHYGSKAVGLNEALPAPILKLAGSHKPIVGTIRDAILKIASTNTAWMDLTPEIRGVLKTPEMVEVVSQIYAQKLF